MSDERETQNVEGNPSIVHPALRVLTFKEEAEAMKVASVRGIRMAYDDAGAGMPVVLLHGYPFNRSMWREQAEFLSESYRVITPDLRGLGETTSQSEEATTMYEMAQDVAALLDYLEIRRAVIVGLSMGGYVTLSFYRRFPLRVRALVLADTRPQSDTEEARRGRMEQAETILRDGMEAIADGFLAKVLTPATLSGRNELVARVRRMITSTDARGAAAALRGMAARPDQTEFLPSIFAPALIIVGSEDKLTTTEDAGLMHREIRGSRLDVINGAAHVSNMERPAEFNRALVHFLQTLQP
jgi:pimeloyl-ACP methyl ester carboxylesterase